MGIFTNPNEMLPFQTLLVPKDNSKINDYICIYKNIQIIILHLIRIFLYNIEIDLEYIKRAHL